MAVLVAAQHDRKQARQEALKIAQTVAGNIHDALEVSRAPATSATARCSQARTSGVIAAVKAPS